MPPFDLTGLTAVLGTGATIALGLTVWLLSVALRALFGGRRRRAAPIHTCCSCVAGLVVFAVVAAVPVLFFAVALATA
jgi:ABC-type multidrug transport system permease subunit